MTFIDNSARTQIELEQAKRSTAQLHTNGRAIHLTVEGEGGLGMTAGNLGLPRYQIVMGFSARKNGVESENFSNTVIKSLFSHWPVEMLDNTQGAKPCEDVNNTFQINDLKRAGLSGAAIPGGT